MSDPTRSHSPDTPPSSGAQTPVSPSTNPDLFVSVSVSGSGSSYLTNMWTGLIRRFSAEDDLDPEHHAHHQQLQQQYGASPKDGINGVFVPVRRTASPFRPPPLDPLVLRGYREGTPHSARLLSQAVAEEVRAMVPERLRIVEDWRLVYGLDQDGASLTTLYQRCRQYEGRRVGFVLVVRDEEGAVC